MLELLYAVIVCILSYFLGCFSTARVIAKNFRNLNVYKIGFGFADTENIYSNISKPLGVLAAFIDSGKMALYLIFLKYLFTYLNFAILSNEIMIFVFGFFMIAGHCLPVTHSFKGGRGIFTYIGLLIVFIPLPMLYVLTISFAIIILFKQIRFAQYLIVLIPPVLSFFWGKPRQLVILMSITAFLMGLLNFIVAKRLGEL